MTPQSPGGGVHIFEKNSGVEAAGGVPPSALEGVYTSGKKKSGIAGGTTQHWCWCVAVLVCLSICALLCWRFGVLVCSCIDSDVHSKKGSVKKVHSFEDLIDKLSRYKNLSKCRII